MGAKIGAAEPWEKVMEGESGPTLDLRLSCWESGLMDNLRIQEPLEDRESRESSAMGVAGAKSPCLIDGCRPIEDFGGVICVWEDRRGIRVRLVALKEEGCCCVESCMELLFEGTGTVELVVPGRDEKTLRKSLSDIIDLLLFESGCGADCPSANSPKVRPVAAAATAVPAPMS